MLKKFFGGKGSEKTGPSRPEATHSIDDLITLERYDEAIAELEQRTKRQPRDLHSHLKLANVYAATRQAAKALDRYLFVADSYTEDGFYDRALALLAKVAKLAPHDDSVLARTTRIQKLKALEHSRVQVVQGLVRGGEGESPLERTSPVDAQRVWQGIAGSKLVERLGPDQLKRLMSAVAITDWDVGETVAASESGVARMFIVVSGQVEAVLPDPATGKNLQLRTFAPGDLFGESVLLEHKLWPATYRVVERARLLRLDRAGLEKAMTGNPDPRALLEALRVQHSDRDVAAAVAKLLTSPG